MFGQLTAPRLCARADLRVRWRSQAALAVFVAVAGGLVLGLVAGAQRTATAYPRLLVAQHGADAVVYLPQGGIGPSGVQHVPEVTASTVLVGLASDATDFIPAVVRGAAAVDTPRILSGRALRPDRADEVVVGFVLAGELHLHVGSTMKVGFLPSPVVTPVTSRFKVVGIEAAPGEFPPRLAGTNVAYFSPAFLRSPLGREAAQGSSNVVFVRLRHGSSDIEALRRALYQREGGPVSVVKMSDLTSNVQRSIHYEVLALDILAALAGVTLALVLIQLLLREGSLRVAEYEPMRALGMTSGQLVATGMASIGATAAAGTAGALAVATAFSPLLPIGTAGVAEPDPGVSVNFAVFGIGASAILLVVGLFGALTLLQVVRRRSDGAPQRAPTLLALPTTATLGAWMALHPGRGRSAVPLRSTVTAIAIGVGATIGVVIFGASLSHLLGTPRLYGATFDADVEANGNFSDVRPALPAVSRDRDVTGIALGQTGIPLQSGVVTFGAQLMVPIRGSIDPPVIAGRLPRAKDEMALGSVTLASLHRGIGDTVPVSLAGLNRQAVPVHIVGTVVLPAFADTEQLGTGGAVSPGFLSYLRVPFAAPPPSDILVTFHKRPGVAGQIAALRRSVPPEAVVYGAAQPTGVIDFGQVRALPTILALGLAAIAMATLAHMSISGVNRRRRELAVFKVLGLTPRGVSAVVAWQATVVTALALVVALPLGVVAGRWAWSVVAARLGAVTEISVPVTVVVALAVLAIVVSNLVAAMPALRAGRIRPGVVIRTE